MNRPLTALSLATLALAAPVAFAADGAPPPDCHGVNVKDATGDNTDATAGDEGGPSSDLTGGYITYDPASKTAKANIVVAELIEGDIDPPYVGIGWEFTFTTNDGPRFVRAYQDRTGIVKWTWGEPRAITDDQTTPRAGGTTTGALYPGKDGVISIDIPMADIGAPAGSTLKALGLEVRQWLNVVPAAAPNPPSAVPLYSVAPIYDTAAGKGTVVLADCPAAAPVPDPGPLPPVAAAPERLEVKVKVPKLSARRLSRKRNVTIKLTGNATDIVAAVKKGATPGGKVVASGKLAKVAKRGKLKLKFRGKTRKGRYTLFMSGRNANGDAAEGAIGLKIRK